MNSTQLGTFPELHFRRPARKKRSGEQDKDKQIDGGRTNGSFLVQKRF